MHPRYYDHSRPFSRGISYEEPPPPPRSDDYGFRSYPPPPFSSHHQERDIGFHDNSYPPYRNVVYPDYDRYGSSGHESSRVGPPHYAAGYGPTYSCGRRSPQNKYSNRPYEDQIYYRDNQEPSPPPEVYPREYRPAAAYAQYEPGKLFDSNRSPNRLYSFGNNTRRVKGGKRVVGRTPAVDANNTDNNNSSANKPVVIESEPEEEKHDPAVEQMARSTLTSLNYRIAMSLLAFNLTIPAIEMPPFVTTYAKTQPSTAQTAAAAGSAAVAKRTIEAIEVPTAGTTPKRQRSDDSAVSREGATGSAEKEVRTSASKSASKRPELPPLASQQQRPPPPPGPPSRSTSDTFEVSHRSSRFSRDRSEESRHSQAQFHRQQPPPPPLPMRNDENSRIMHRSRSESARYESIPPSLQRSSSGLEYPPPPPYDGRSVRAYSGGSYGREGYEPPRSRFSDHGSHAPAIPPPPQYQHRYPDDRTSPRRYPASQGYDERERRYDGYLPQQPQDYHYGSCHRSQYERDGPDYHFRHHDQPSPHGWGRGGPPQPAPPAGYDGYRKAPLPLAAPGSYPQGGYDNSSGYVANPLRTPR